MNTQKLAYKNSLTNRLLNVGNRYNIKSPIYYETIAGMNIIGLVDNWFDVFRMHFFKKKEQNILVKLRNGKKFICSGPADLSMLTEIWSLEEYNPINLPIKQDYTIIDIGAHVGFFSIYAGYHAKKGRVYAFEPFKSNFGQLQRNVKMNRMKNVKTFNMAVASKNGHRKFFISDEHNGCHSLFKRNNSKAFKVRTIDLNTIFDSNNIDRCDFLKMDCEGAEFEIINSASPETLKRIQVIAGELHSDLLKKDEIKRMFDHLKKNGFTISVNKGLFFALK